MTIEIEDLIFETIIGVLDYERVNKQKVIVNLKALYDYKDGEYINYVSLVNIIKNSMIEEKFQLLEDALESINLKIKNQYPNIKKLYLKISKPNILSDCNVSLSKRWHLHSYQES